MTDKKEIKSPHFAFLKISANSHWHIWFCRHTGQILGNNSYFCRAIKFLTFILASIILFLAIKPGIDTISLQTESPQGCCAQCTSHSTSDNSHSQKKQDNENSDKSCNPFQVCSSCVLVCYNVPSDYLSKPTVFSDKVITYLSTFTSQFVSDFWHPPKIV